MKYLKTYNEINEGLRDKMVGKPNVIDSLKKLSLEELNKSLEKYWYKERRWMPLQTKSFTEFVERILGRDLWEELKKPYIERGYDNDIHLINVILGHYNTIEKIIKFSEFSKDDIIKLILALYEN